MQLKDQVTQTTRRTLRGGGYDAIHCWLKRHYGKADKCESPNCTGKSKMFHWAKIKGLKYEHKRENFRMLCASCRRLYDMTPEIARRISEVRIGIPKTEKHKNKISQSCKGMHKGNKHSARRVVQRNLGGEFIKEWDSILEAARYLGLTASGITLACRGYIKSSGKFLWSYLDR